MVSASLHSSDLRYSRTSKPFSVDLLQHACPFTVDFSLQAAKERAIAEKEKESYKWHMRIISGGPRRRADRGSFGQQVGSDGWGGAVGSSGPLRPRPKAGDLTNFGKINKSALMTF